jgi:hypothetical protein
MDAHRTDITWRNSLDVDRCPALVPIDRMRAGSLMSDSRPGTGSEDLVIAVHIPTGVAAVLPSKASFRRTSKFVF